MQDGGNEGHDEEFESGEWWRIDLPRQRRRRQQSGPNERWHACRGKIDSTSSMDRFKFSLGLSLNFDCQD